MEGQGRKGKQIFFHQAEWYFGDAPSKLACEFFEIKSETCGATSNTDK